MKNSHNQPHFVQKFVWLLKDYKFKWSDIFFFDNDNLYISYQTQQTESVKIKGRVSKTSSANT